MATEHKRTSAKTARSLTVSRQRPVEARRGGLQKWFAFPSPNPLLANIQLLSLIGIAGIIEIIGGTLVTLGLYTRAAAFIMSGEMAVSHFLTRSSRGFMPIVNGGTLEVLYCFVFFYLIFAGAGPWSIDALRERRD